MAKVRAHDLLRLAVAAVCDHRTARRWYQDPSKIRENNRVRLEQAARRLGLPLPGVPTK